ncbi:protein-disulfide reductase DsbD [Vibrio sp.]|uniref:protein-disulfide reductase DsbD n=1 Tax=Vibrio sp. TaxID=678 RepID=UPI003D11A377
MHYLISLFLLCLSVISAPATAELFGNNNAPALNNGGSKFVPVDQAFPFNGYQQGDHVYLDWQVKPDYYLYQQRITISGDNVNVASIDMQDGEPYRDEFFGDVNIYTKPLYVEVRLSDFQPGARLLVQYQGCAKAGFCYPPETRVIELSAFDNSATPPTGGKANVTANKTVATQSDPASGNGSKDASLAAELADNWWTPLLFLLFGIGLAFTPCVLPMYPILTSIVLGGGKLSHSRALLLSIIYVQGMALTYTLLGLVVASAGLQFQAALQHPYVLVGLSALFIALALSMFGVYTLQLPSGLQTWLNNLSNKQQGGNYAGVFAMGAISGLVCSPCTTAPLSGALLYVAQSGDLLTGGVALYALALGMGIPLILAAVFGNKLLPRAGAWMDNVKILFGFVLLAAPIFLLERILDESVAVWLWSLLGICAFSWLYHKKNSLPFGGWKQSAIGIIAMLGLLGSALPLYQHLTDSQPLQSRETEVNFIRIASVNELNQQLELAKQAGKPVMLDFYADWCVACKEFDKYTFHDPDVAKKLSEFVLLQADVTKNMPQDIQLLETMNVLGLPTIDFWQADGTPLKDARLTGFMNAEDFAAHLEKYQL